MTGPATGATGAPVLLIGGGAGSGKSELAKGLAAADPGLAVVHLDDFYHSDPDAGVTVEKLDGTGLVLDRAHPGSLDLGRALAAVDRARAARAVVVEGVFALCFPDLRKRAALSVYVDTPDDVRLARKMLRKLQAGEPDAVLMLRNYLHFSRPRHATHIAPTRRHADLVLDGLEPVPGLVAATAAAFAADTP
ncbi:uridine kinase family protein [Streptomyces griseosporeus]